MPDLLSALDKIAHETEQITHLSHANDRPPGRFTSAYLYLPTPGVRGVPNLFSLVRDATEAEKRPFGRLLAPSGASDPSRSIRDVSKRQSDAPTHGLTPLRNAQRARGTQHELEATLYAAEEVIEAMADSAHPMNRARKEVNDLIAQHEANDKRVAELERLLSEAMRGPKPQSEPEKKEEKEVEEKKEKAKSPDEAIAAEEEALRALEESLAPLRRQAAEKAQAARSPRKSAPSSPSVDRTPLARSTGLRRSQGPSSPSASKSPSSPKVSPKASTSTSRTPRRTPGAPAARTPLSSRHPLETPRRVAEPINRFSPLHLVATPRARLGSSTLRPGPEPGSTIVARMRASITPAAPRSAYRSGFLGASTSRRVLPPPAASPAQEAVLVPDLSTTPKAAAAALAGTPAPAKEPPPPSPAKEPEGPSINPDMPSVATATASIRRTLPPEVFRMTLHAGESCGEAPSDIITHLTALSRAPLPTPQSPSAASTTDSAPTSSAATDAIAPPVTREAILSAHLCLIMLAHLGDGAPDAEANHVPEADVKAELAAVAGKRGWEEGSAHNVIYQARGLKLLGTQWRSRKIFFR